MNIFIGNLSKETTVKELEEKFSSFGTINSCKIIKDVMSGESKGFGFVEMPDSGEANKAMHELNSIELDGKKIVVNEARPKSSNRSSAPRSSSGFSSKRW